MFAYNYKNIVLRDLTERDIPDRIRWLTEETAWGDWDAPGEPIEPIDPQLYRAEMLNVVQEVAAKPDSEHRWQFEADATRWALIFADTAIGIRAWASTSWPH